jgi:hypothetical protein
MCEQEKVFLVIRDGNSKLKNQLKFAGVQIRIGPGRVQGQRPVRGTRGGFAPLKKTKFSNCEDIFYGFPARKSNQNTNV